MDLCSLRERHEEDTPFIRDSWLRSYARHASEEPIKGQVNNKKKVTVGLRNWLERKSIGPARTSSEVYIKEQYRIITALIERGTALLACSNEDASQVFGYSVYENQNECMIFHYIYVKESFRNLGLGGHMVKTIVELAKGSPLYATHWNKKFAKLVGDLKVTYNPYKIFLR